MRLFMWFLLGASVVLLIVILLAMGGPASAQEDFDPYQGGVLYEVDGFGERIISHRLMNHEIVFETPDLSAEVLEVYPLQDGRVLMFYGYTLSQVTGVNSFEVLLPSRNENGDLWRAAVPYAGQFALIERNLNGVSSIYKYDVINGGVEQFVSVGFNPQISVDGRIFLFESSNTIFVFGGNFSVQVQGSMPMLGQSGLYYIAGDLHLWYVSFTVEMEFLQLTLMGDADTYVPCYGNVFIERGGHIYLYELVHEPVLITAAPTNWHVTCMGSQGNFAYYSNRHDGITSLMVYANGEERDLISGSEPSLDLVWVPSE